MAGTTVVRRSTALSDSDVYELAKTQYPAVLVDLEKIRGVLAESDILIEELHDDHATQRTLNVELIADHATFKTAADGVETLAEELHDDHATLIAVIADLKTQLNRVIGASDNLITAPGLAIGSTTTAVANAAFTFRVNGVTYAKAAVAAGTAPGNDVIPQSTYGAVALDTDSAGTISATEAADNATGYASAALAIAGIPAVAADKVRMGTVTATKSDGAFTFGTTALNAASTTVAYTDGTTDTTVATSPPATLTAPKPASAPATLTATSPATLTASKPTSANVNAAGDLTAATITLV